MSIRKEGAGAARLKTIWKAIRQAVVAEVAAAAAAAKAAIEAAVKLIQILNRSQSCSSGYLHTMLLVLRIFRILSCDINIDISVIGRR